MTSASQGGYVASQSTARASTYYGWKAFDQDETVLSRWQSDDNTFSSSSPHTWSGSTVQFTDTDGGTHSGEWIKLKLPKKIKLEHIIFKLWYPSYTPRDFVILGSNDDTNWKLLKTVADTAEQGSNGDLIPYKHNVNATTKYDYYVLLVSETGTHNTMLTELEYYGHEEGDSSLDTTLKSVYNVPGTQQLEVYYDAKDLTAMPGTVTDLAGGDQNGAVTGHSPTLDETGGINSFVFDGTGGYIESTLTNDSGAWIFSKSLWFKQTVEPTNLSCMSSIGDYSASDATFFYLHSNHILVSIYSSGAYFPREWVVNEWTHAVVVMKGTTSSINDIELYINGKKVEATSQFGTATTRTLPTNAQLRVGREIGVGTSYFTGSIANFRLFSKALNADQVRELYDYQKDYFLGSRSSVTLYKGHLGIGVAEPSGQLELAGDERIQQYPPRALTGYETLVEGHGVFKAYGFQPHASYPAWKAFDDTATNSVWYSDTLSEYTGTGEYNGSTRLASETVKGAYIVLEMPYEIVLKQIKFWQQTNGSHVWDRGVYYAKCNPSDEWAAIHNVTDRPANDTTPYVAYITDPRPYKYFAIVITRRVAGSTAGVSIRDLQFFGTPGPTTLDKGSLTLGRSLDVPRISRYDVDTET
ncbi:MAG: LamG domain-containing protein, partial [Flavobacteriales bacterium]